VPVFAIGDIHGNLAALRDMLDQLRPEIAAGDSIVFLGDYIDRGPDARGCVEAILAFRQETPATVVCLRGNHEDWMLRTRQNHTKHSWLTSMDALETIRSYSPDAARTLRNAMREPGLRLYLGGCRLPYEPFFAAMPASHHEFFDTLNRSFEAEGCFYSHAGVDPAVSGFDQQTEEALLWGILGFPRAYSGDTTVVYGHWNNAVVDASRWPRPRMTASTIGIDTSAHGVLTAIRMPDRRVFQSARYLSAEEASTG
jgi:serine/threonine protein phosphatase 1